LIFEHRSVILFPHAEGKPAFRMQAAVRGYRRIMENVRELIMKSGHVDSGDRNYLCIDLKSFYASVECVERGLDPMTTDLVVADPTRSDKTICLAVSPSLKAQGVSGRARVFEIPKHLKYIMAPPRMQLYIDYAAKIYSVYLDYISPDDMHVYSIDEVFLDVTHYLGRYGYTPREMADFLMTEVANRVGVRATAGIGTNMYLAKIALDITAKHSPDFIGYLDQQSYINTLWNHRPITDFWRIGPGTARRLARIGVNDQRGIAKTDEELLYKMFGIDAELLIDHAWGVEPTTIEDIKGYKHKSRSLSRGQVLMRDYAHDEGALIVKEMTEQLCLEMTDLGKGTKNVSIGVGYSNALRLPPARGSVSFPALTNAGTVIVPAVADLYRRITDKNLQIRRVYINFNDIKPMDSDRQVSLFDLAEREAEDAGRTVGRRRSDAMADPLAAENARRRRDAALQEAVNNIRKKYGKDAMIKGMDLEEGATTIERNHQIGGHKE